MESKRLHLLHILQSELSQEFRRINENFNLKLPFLRIALSDALKNWGEFHALHHTIFLNENLILQKPWHVTLEILKHELAHAWVFFHGDAEGESDHGLSFKKICEKLGLSAWARQATGSEQDIPERISWEKIDDPVLRRIEKLLALAQSSNEHEAALAMEKARSLAKAHRFDTGFNQHENIDFTYLVIDTGSKRVSLEMSSIASILSEFFFVEVIHASYFNALRGEKTRALYLCGKQRDVLMAEYVFYFMKHTIERLWQDFKQGKNLKGISARRSYQLGLIKGFRKKLQESQKQDRAADSQEAGLILQTEDELKKYLRKLFPYIQTQGSRGVSINPSVYAQGQSDGRRITLSKPVTQRDGFGGYLS